MSGKNILKLSFLTFLLVFIALNHFLLLGRLMCLNWIEQINYTLDESNFLGFFESSVAIWSEGLKDNSSEIFYVPKKETNEATKDEHDILDIELGK